MHHQRKFNPDAARRHAFKLLATSEEAWDDAMAARLSRAARDLLGRIAEEEERVAQVELRLRRLHDHACPQ
jgi:hypothetical protein